MLRCILKYPNICHLKKKSNCACNVKTTLRQLLSSGYKALKVFTYFSLIRLIPNFMICT